MTSIGLVQINNSFSGQSYLPYSVGLLQAYVEQHAPNRFSFLPAIYRRKPISQIVEQLETADVAGFSSYVWNHEISLEVARRLKSQNKEVLIVFGGPQVPDNAEGWLREHPFIDVAVHNEGEQTFLDLLNSQSDQDWMEISGLSFVTQSGEYVRTPSRVRFRDLNDVPSPFLEGTFDALIADNPEETWIGLWETNRGCPFSCTFCDWGSAIASKVTKFGLDRLVDEVEWFARQEIEYVFCCDANFGILKRDVDLAQRVADISARTGFPKALSVQNTKNATERAYLTQKILSDAGLNKGVTLSMQSLDGETLNFIKRDNISGEMYSDLQQRFTREGVETYSDLILGLPGETYQSFKKGVHQLIETGQHNRIQFNNLSVLPNAEMADPSYMKAHQIDVVRSEIINIHGERVVQVDDVPEYQDLVISTASMPTDDWRRTRAFSWMVAFLYFDKILQIPLMLMHEASSVGYDDLVEAFMNADEDDFPLINEIVDFFVSEAESIQHGGPEYVYSEDYLGIFWPADEYMFIKLTTGGQISAFYQEAEKLFVQWIEDDSLTVPVAALRDAIKLNEALLKQPFLKDDLILQLDFDIPSFYADIKTGKVSPLDGRAVSVTVERSQHFYDDLQKWCREVVWWGNKKGAYLYTNQLTEKQIAGHY